MAKIRHIAFTTENPGQVAEFYKEAFGMEIIRRSDNGAVLLSDGYINLAVLKFKNDDAADTEGAPRHTGIHHFGFKVEGMEEAQEQILSAGATKKQSAITDANGHARTGNVEVKFTGPDGITVDLSETGWAGASKD